MKRLLMGLAVSMGWTGPGLLAQEPTSAQRPRAVATQAVAEPTAHETPTVGRGDDEKAIKTLLDTFIKAFNAGNAEAAAATYSETAVVVDESGERLEGRAAIRSTVCRVVRRRSREHDHDPGRRAALPRPGDRPRGGPRDDHASRRCRAAEITRFTTVYVKQGGQWLQAAVRDELAHDVAPHERLKELEWLVGDWVNESQDAVVDTTCTWAKGGNFLDREFTMKVEGPARALGHAADRLGPAQATVQDVDLRLRGGPRRGLSTRATGDQWVIKSEGVRQDGQPASATNVITRLGKDRMSWQSTAITLGGSRCPGSTSSSWFASPLRWAGK